MAAPWVFLLYGASTGGREFQFMGVGELAFEVLKYDGGMTGSRIAAGLDRCAVQRDCSTYTTYGFLK